MMKCLLAASVLVCVLTLPAFAAGVWDDGGANTSWNTVDNWDDNVVPASGSDVTFATAGTIAVLDSNRTIGDLAFTTAFEIDQGYNTLTIDGNVTVAAGINVSFTDPKRMYVADGSIWDVGAGSNLLYNGDHGGNSGFLDFTNKTITKAGDGTLKIDGGYYLNNQNYLGGFDIQGGVVRMQTPATVGALTGDGTFSGDDGVLHFVKSHRTTDCEFQGVLEMRRGVYKKYAPNTFTISGADGRIDFDNGDWEREIHLDNGTLLFDNTAVSVTKRLIKVKSLMLGGGTMSLIGKDEDVSEWDIDNLYVKYRLGTLSATHGAGSLARIQIRNLEDNANRGMLMLTGTDLGGTGAGASMIKFYYAPTMYDGILPGWVRVDDEFAAHEYGAAGLGASALPAAGRPGQVEGATDTDNVLVNSAQSTLTGDTTVNSLKIDGTYAVDLGGNTLTIDTGGLIQTGAANNGIENGTLHATQLDIQTAQDLTISAAVTAPRITKMGAGKLALTGALPVDARIFWIEGPLEVTNDNNFAVTADTLEETATLTKHGSGTMTMTAVATTYSETFQNMVVTGGRIKYSAKDQLGFGTAHITNGATLEIISAYGVYPNNTVSLENGGKIEFVTAGTSYYGLENTTVVIEDVGEVVNNSGASKYLRGVLETDGGTLIKSGASTVYLYSGQLDVSGFSGTLDVAEGLLGAQSGASTPLGTNDSLRVRSGATMYFTWYQPNIYYSQVSGEGRIRISSDRLDSYAVGWKPGGPTGPGTFSIYKDGTPGGAQLALYTYGGNNGSLEIEFADAGNDVLAVDGRITGLANTDLDIRLAAPSSSFDPTGGITGTFLTAAGSGISGSFASVGHSSPAPLNPSVSSGTVASFYDVSAAVVNYDTFETGVSVPAGMWTAHPGDANLDDKVDVFDLAILANNYGTTGDKDWTLADFTLSADSDPTKFVDVFDLAILANNYGWVAGGGAPVPEPMSLALLGLGGLALIRRRRR